MKTPTDSAESLFMKQKLWSSSSFSSSNSQQCFLQDFMSLSHGCPVLHQFFEVCRNSFLPVSEKCSLALNVWVDRIWRVEDLMICFVCACLGMWSGRTSWSESTTASSSWKKKCDWATWNDDTESRWTHTHTLVQRRTDVWTASSCFYNDRADVLQ